MRQEESLKEIYSQGALKKGMNLTQARAILWGFTGRDMWRLVVVKRGWSSEAYELWLAELLTMTLTD